LHIIQNSSLSNKRFFLVKQTLVIIITIIRWNKARKNILLLRNSNDEKNEKEKLFPSDKYNELGKENESLNYLD
jgi:hypothetical protein